MMHGSQFVELMATHVEVSDRQYLPRRYEVSAVSAGLVTLRDVVSGEVIDESFAALRGYNYTVGMEVMAIPVGQQELFILGPVQRSAPGLLDFGSEFIGQSYYDWARSTNSTNNNNASATNWVVALGTTVTVPNGTYDILAEGHCLMAHDTSLANNLRLTIEGTSDSGVTSPNLTTAAQTRVGTAYLRTGVVVSDGTISVDLEYKANAAGGATGASARNNVIIVIATRTA